MAKGNIVKLIFSSFIDDDSKNEIIRLTPKGVLCHRNYFYQKCFTNDGQKILFAGEFDKCRNYYLLNLQNQSALQLTEGAGDNTFGGFLSPDDKFLYYVKNERNLQRVDLETLEEQTIYSVPNEWVGYGTWVANSDCTKIVGIEIAKKDWTPLTDWELFKAFYDKEPRCRLININIKTGKAKTVIEQHVWLGHPIFRPFHDETIAFCHEGPHDLVDARMWLINNDGSNERKAHEHQPGESCTHEFWVPNGSGLAYVSYMKGQQERYIRIYNPDTKQDEMVMEMPACSHLMSNFDGSLYIGDGSGSPVDVKDTGSYKIQNDPWLYILTPKNKNVHKLVKHNSSWRVLDGDRQVTHPHPSFSPDNQYVLYSCDADDIPALYLTKVPSSILNEM
ncbi:oligogalacturonate lyase family protein [Orbus wheelerorum]|uniref:oligogalacturonate lyase family protein n=1 Tax=Orbus wheelerorum TaxID=3074111 RepID=UPI00370D80F1